MPRNSLGLSAEQIERRKVSQLAYREKNRDRIRLYARQWYLDHKERSQQWAKQKFAKNPEKHRALVRKNYLDRSFGPGGAEYYEKVFTEQRGCCAICGEPPRTGKWGRLHQDHDTKCCPYGKRMGRKGRARMLRTCGKCRRGLLCNNCNTALSGLERDGWLRKALRYLRKWQSNGGSGGQQPSGPDIVTQLNMLKKQLADSLAEYDQKHRTSQAN
jgi:recombination endonuclease VII